MVIRSHAILEGITAEEIYENLTNYDVRTKWDTIIGEYKTLEKTDNSDVLYYVVNVNIFSFTEIDLATFIIGEFKRLYYKQNILQRLPK